MNCRQFERRLFEYLDGALSTRQRSACDRHVASCSECRAVLDAEKASAARIHAALDNRVKRLALSPEARLAIVRSTEDEGVGGRCPPMVPRWRVPSAAWLAAAAGFVLVLGFGLRGVIPTDPGQQRTTSEAARPAITFHIPALDEAPTARTVERTSEVAYGINVTRVIDPAKDGAGGRMGIGAANGPGGWPDGSENAKFRFIRLEYSGTGWDDGMDAVSRADRNFLDEFRKLTGFKTAEASESHPIALLAKYPKGVAPPFVYMTGNGDIDVPAKDMGILRDYLVNGGMLFADCSSERWDKSFRSFLRQVLPEKELLVIADDDPIFQVPFVFANGAPPLWHYGGMRAMGIKNQNRWLVFYHPGNLKNAWKTGHSGLADALAKGSLEMGVNIVYYSFTHYLEETREQRRGFGAYNSPPFYGIARAPPYVEVDEGALAAWGRTAARSFEKGVLTIQPAGEKPVQLDGYPPWAFCALESVRIFASAPVKHKALTLLRDRVAYGQDIMAVMETLKDLPFEAYEISSVGSAKGSPYALLMDLGRQQYAVLLFGRRDTRLSPLQDAFLVVVRKNVADLLFDVIPRFEVPTPAYVNRFLSHYEARFSFTPREMLTSRIRKEREPVVPHVLQVARPGEIPRNPEPDTKGLSEQLDRIESQKLHAQ